MAGEFDDLFRSDIGATSWYDHAPDEQKAWIRNVADLMAEKGQKPIWAKVGRAFRTEFNLDGHPVDTTIQSTIERIAGG